MDGRVILDFKRDGFYKIKSGKLSVETMEKLVYSEDIRDFDAIYSELSDNGVFEEVKEVIGEGIDTCDIFYTEACIFDDPDYDDVFVLNYIFGYGEYYIVGTVLLVETLGYVDSVSYLIDASYIYDLLDDLIYVVKRDMYNSITLSGSNRYVNEVLSDSFLRVIKDLWIDKLLKK